jgi:glucose 1-dehydrogenase
MMADESNRRIQVDLSGRTAIVTGASRGIGRAIALRLAAAGAKVACVARSVEKLQETADAISAAGGTAEVHPCDVTDSAAVSKLVEDLAEKWEGIDILVNNAGITKDTLIPRMTDEDWDTVIATNLTGGFLCAREAVRRFRAKGRRPEISSALGKIVFNSSVHETIPWARRVNYAASKGGLSQLMKSLAQEVAPEGIRVNSVAPGAIATDINRAQREAGKEEMLKRIPFGRIGEPDDVARTIVWLCTDASDYVVGHTLFVDGGMALYPGFHGEG